MAENKYVIFVEDGTIAELKEELIPKVSEGVPYYGMKLMPRESLMKKMRWTEQDLDDEECIYREFRVVDVRIKLNKIFVSVDVQGKKSFTDAEDALLRDQIVNLQKQIQILKNENFALHNITSDLRNRIKKVVAETQEMQKPLEPKTFEGQPLPDFMGGGR